MGVLALAAAVNLAFVGIEAAYGLIGHSMALLADAGHNLGDVLGLVAAWGASALVQLRPTVRYTYGLRSSSILAALFNAIVLLVAVGAIMVGAIQRFSSPEPVAEVTVIVVAAVGVLVNGATALLLIRRQHTDLNVAGAFTHMVADALVSIGVVVSGLVILKTGWLWLDPAVSLVIGMVIIAGTWRLLRKALDMALHAVPPSIDADVVRAFLLQVAGVCGVHDLHIWPMSTTETALTCHLVMPGGHPGDAALERLAHDLHDRFAIDHATVQVETGDPEHPCRLVPDHIV
jgi:cobalt-zinc-cadmium efflux system protein